MDISKFRLPRFNEIPGVGLYLKQVVTFINETTEPLLHSQATVTMLSNYVKLKLISNPVKKMYSREQIAALVFIVLTKNVLSLDNAHKLLNLQGENTAEAYDRFCECFEFALKKVCGNETETPFAISSDADGLMEQVIITLAHKIYIDERFLELT